MAAAAAAMHPRRQEPLAISQLQAMRKAPQQRPCAPATTTPQAPKRPAPQVVEQPSPKRMCAAAVLPPLQMPPRPQPHPQHGHGVVGYARWKQPSWYPAPALPQQLQAPTAATVLVPPRPAADQAPPNTMEEDDELTSLLAAELELALEEEEDTRLLAAEIESALEEEEDTRLLAAEIESALEEEEETSLLAAELESALEEEEDTSLFAAELELALEEEEDHGIGIVQEEEEEEEAGDGDMDGFVSRLEGELDLVLQKEHAKIQDEEGQHQHARSLEGLVVDERGDDLVAHDFFHMLNNHDIHDLTEEGEEVDWASIPLSAYKDLPY